VARTRDAPDLIALDTSCMIALVWGAHEHHAATTSLVEQRLDDGARLVLATHSLIEAYSVLTRLPAPHRLAPTDALAVLRDSFRDQAKTVALTAREYWPVIEQAVQDGVHGGRTYDFLIASCARKARARELVTLNARHFDSFADDRLQITSPI
jgi:predicted nucleic acid-binding protein